MVNPRDFVIFPYFSRDVPWIFPRDFPMVFQRPAETSLCPEAAEETCCGASRFLGLDMIYNN